MKIAALIPLLRNLTTLSMLIPAEYVRFPGSGWRSEEKGTRGFRNYGNSSDSANRAEETDSVFHPLTAQVQVADHLQQSRCHI